VLGCNSAIVDDGSILNHYNLDARGNEIINLPKKLKEISGLAYIDDNHLLTHNDEEGIVYKFSISSGKVISEYFIGQKEIEKDFEGIAIVQDSVYLVASNGTLFKFSLFDGKNDIEYVKINTPLSSKNNVEGLCYDESTNSLLLACKGDPGKDYKNYKAVYEFSLSHMKLIDKPKYLISLKKLKKKFDIDDFSPSGIEVSPINKNLFLISANPEVILELDTEGKILCAKELKDKNHKQPEGITFLMNGELILADEANGQNAKLTLIPFIE
jgi:uncharacterized protein YjiK